MHQHTQSEQSQFLGSQSPNVNTSIEGSDGQPSLQGNSQLNHPPHNLLKNNEHQFQNPAQLRTHLISQQTLCKISVLAIITLFISCYNIDKYRNRMSQAEKYQIVGTTVGRYNTYMYKPIAQHDHQDEHVSLNKLQDFSCQDYLKILPRRAFGKQIGQNYRQNERMYYNDQKILDSSDNQYRPQRMSYITQKRVRLGIPSHKYRYTLHYNSQIPDSFVNRDQIQSYTITLQQSSSFHYDIKSKIKQQTACLVMNQLNVLTERSLLTIKMFLLSGVVHSAVLFGHFSKAQQTLLENVFKRTNNKQISLKFQFQLRYDRQKITTDYTFLFNSLKHPKEGLCTKLVYISSHFGTNSEMVDNLKKQLKNLKQYGVIYSRQVLYDDGKGNGARKVGMLLLDQQDLGQLDAGQYSQYLYVIDPKIYLYATPMNFAYYTKYTLQQLLIIPVLTLSQLANKLKPSLPHNLHSINLFTKMALDSREYSIESLKKEKNGVCFVSASSSPDKIDIKELERYIKGVVKGAGQSGNISIVIYLPYNYTMLKDLQLQTNIISIIRSLTNSIKTNPYSTNSYININRLRIRLINNRAVVPHGVYEAVYHYCPDKAMIVTSRHNVVFYPRFVDAIISEHNQKYHYMFANIRRESHNKTDSKSTPNRRIIKFDQAPIYIRTPIRHSTLFTTHLQHMQIFKSDFMKTNIFWILKSAQFQFYQTEACYVTLMMEEVRLRIQMIGNGNVLAEVWDRPVTQVETQQIANIANYAEYSQLISNLLMPIEYNCLDNIAFRRHAPDKIPRKIHQIWLSSQQISPIRQALHVSITQTHPNYKIHLHKFPDVNPQSFPHTYMLVQRTLQYHKTSPTSLLTMAADLLRYEVLYVHGGIYIDFKMQSKKPLDNFLKYEIFFIDCDIHEIRFRWPQAVGIGVMGAVPNSYYLGILLKELISQVSFDYTRSIPHTTGGYVVRKAFNNQQFFINMGLGYHLLFPFPYDYPVNLCGGVDKKFDKDQQVYELTNSQNITVKVGLPCKQYPEAYLISYTPLARTWLSDKSLTIS